jgi:hypothetical protein
MLKPMSEPTEMPKLTAPSAALVVLRGRHAREMKAATGSTSNVRKGERLVAIVMPREQRG